MRLTNVFGGRPAFYDRNPTSIVQSYSATIAPAAITTRWSYTVPAARKAQVESALCFTGRATVATTASTCIDNVAIGPGGAGFGNILRAQISLANTVNDLGQANTGNMGTLVATDVLQAQTLDLSTGGTVAFNMAAKLTEYDA